jgi:hypothetical protein
METSPSALGQVFNQTLPEAMVGTVEPSVYLGLVLILVGIQVLQVEMERTELVTEQDF